MSDQSTTERTHTCECGFAWRHGLSGAHICAPYYRKRIAELESALQAVRSLAEKWNKDAIDTGFAMSEPANELFEVLDAIAAQQKDDKA